MKVVVVPQDNHYILGQLTYHDSGPHFEGASLEVTPAFVKVDGEVVLTASPSNIEAWTGGSETPHRWDDRHENQWTGFTVIIEDADKPNV